MRYKIEEDAFKIYRFVPDYRFTNNANLEHTPPIDIDFRTGLKSNLVRKTIIFRGERVLTQYYESFDLPTTEAPDGTFNNLILEVRHTYRRGLNPIDPRLAVSRSSEIHWQLETGEFSETFKYIDKVYSNFERQLEEVQVRRRNAANELANMVVRSFGSSVTSPVTEEVLTWQVVYRSEIDAWIQSGAFTSLLATIPDNTDVNWGQTLKNGLTVSDQFKDYISTI